jgi:hypothetical protein
MKKAAVLSILIAAVLLAVAVIAEAQQPKKMPRIGYLAGDPRSPSREAFRQGLKDLGYLEGQNILIEWRYAEDKPELFPERATELVCLKVDAIVAANAAAVGLSSGQRRRSRLWWQAMEATSWRMASWPATPGRVETLRALLRLILS